MDAGLVQLHQIPQPAEGANEETLLERHPDSVEAARGLLRGDTPCIVSGSAGFVPGKGQSSVIDLERFSVTVNIRGKESRLSRGGA